jgi:hypothetical protein
MQTAVRAALLEMLAALAAMAAQLEGLRDFARLNLEGPTLAAVRDAIARYERRVRLLTAAQVTLEPLLNDQYPDLGPLEITDAVRADLQANADTIAVALGLFSSNAPTTLGLAAGAVEDK